LKRKNYSKELKTKVALAAIKGNQTANEIASEFGIHVSLVNRWKKEAIEALTSVFGNTQEKQSKEIEIERDRLYQKVGKLQIELDWFKKTPDIFNDHRREKTAYSNRVSGSEYSTAM
jgi:transposase